MDTFSSVDPDLIITRTTSELSDYRSLFRSHHQRSRSATSPATFHIFRLNSSAAVQNQDVQQATSTSDALTSDDGARDRQGRMDRSLDGQSASAVDLDAMSMRSIPDEFKDCFEATKVEAIESGVHEMGRHQEEQPRESEQMAASNIRTWAIHASASGTAEKAMLSEKQLGKLPVSCSWPQPFDTKPPVENEVTKKQAKTQVEEQAEGNHDPSSERMAYDLPKSCEADSGTRIDAHKSAKHQSHILHPRPHNLTKSLPRRALQNWETISAILETLPPPAFAACRTISRYGLGLGSTSAHLDVDDDAKIEGDAEERLERSMLRPVPLIDEGISFPRLYDPAKICTVLISTQGFEESNMLANHIRLSGLKASPDKWALLSMADGDYTSNDDATDDKTNFALVRLMSLEVATILITIFHGGKWTGGGMGVSRRLCVLLVEPRQGGEVLVEGLTMPEGGMEPLVRKLTLFFLGHDL